MSEETPPPAALPDAEARHRMRRVMRGMLTVVILVAASALGGPLRLALLPAVVVALWTLTQSIALWRMGRRRH